MRLPHALPPRVLPAFLALASLLGPAAAPARAEGLVQLHFEGRIAPPGGARVEIEVGGTATRDGQLADFGQKVDFGMYLHLGRGTGARDLVALLAQRLRDQGLDVVEPAGAAATDGDAAARTPPGASLFVDRVRYVRIRLGTGLQGAVTLCEEAPIAVRVLPPGQTKAGARLYVGASTFTPHTGDHSLRALELELGSEASAPEVSEKLAQRAIASGWVCERPALDSWRPHQMLDGARITGCSIELESGADWRLEVELEPAADRR